MNDVQQLTSRKDERESLDKIFHINPWVAFEIQGANDSLAQLAKMKKLPDEFVSNLWDFQAKTNFIKSSLSPIDADMDSRRRYYFDA